MTAQFSAEQIALAVKARDIYWAGKWMRVPEDKQITALRYACRTILKASGSDPAQAPDLATRAIYS